MSQAEFNKQHYQYVLVFNNPYSKSNPVLPKKYLKKITTAKAEERFRNCFRLSDSDPNFYNALQDLKASLTGKDEIKLEKLAQKVFELTLVVLQKNLGIEIKAGLSDENKVIIVSVKTTEENLRLQADVLRYQLRLSGLENDQPFKKYVPFGDYQEDAYEKQIYIEENEEIFKFSDKIRLIHSMITSIIEISELESLKLLTSHFPLHTQELDRFAKTWVKFSRVCKAQDIEAVNNYFGEKISMYFAWLEYYTLWLTIPSVIGLVCGILVYVSDKSQVNFVYMSLGEWALLVFALLLSISSTLMDQLWVRRQNELAWKWGVSDFFHHEPQRSGFKGVYQLDPISGTRKKITNKAVGHKKFFGAIVSMFFVSLVIASILGLTIYKAQLMAMHKNDLAQLIGVANAIQIKILNFVYRYVAKFFADWENYETHTEYMNSFVVKLFCFQFINSYASLYYIAFGKKHFEKCTNDDCLYDLTIQLCSIYLTNFFLNLIELGLPFIKSKLRMRKYRNTMLSPEQYQLIYDEYDEPLDDYMEIVISYGYLVLFGFAFPFTPLIALFLCVIELRVDAWKLCNLTRRPFPAKDGSIGIWLTVLQVMATAGVVTNIGVLIFTSNVFHFDSPEKQWTAFFILEHALLAFKFSLSSLIPDKSDVVCNGIKWGNRIADEKVYGKLTDVNFERNLKGLVFSMPEEPNLIKVEDILA